MIEPFRVPIVLYPEIRQSLHGELRHEACCIRIPVSLLGSKRKAIPALDQLFWRLLALEGQRELTEHTRQLNQSFYQFEFSSVRYRRQFRRWGSCSTRRNINLSHRLIGAPPRLRDYVILHELAHLKHMNHQAHFWFLLQEALPDYRERRKEIHSYSRAWHEEYRDWLEHLIRLLHATA